MGGGSIAKYLLALFILSATMQGGFGRSRMISVVEIPDTRMNEIDGDVTKDTEEDKKHALLTNEIRRDTETSSSQGEEVTHPDAPRPTEKTMEATTFPSFIINAKKPPSTMWEYLKEFTYGVFSWVFGHIFD